MTKVTRLTLEQSGALEQRRLHLREISDEADAPLETVGQDIRAARQRKGEDLATVSRALKIRKDHLDALEEGNIEALPGRPYAIGFLRSYAEYLGLDPAQCVERFKAEIAGRGDDGGELPKLTVEDERHMPQGSLVFLVLLVIAVVYGGYYLSVSASRMLSEPVPPVPDRLAAGQAASPESKIARSRTTADRVSAVTQPALSSAERAASDASATSAPMVAMPPDAEISEREAAEIEPPPLARLYGARNVGTRVEIRVHRPTRILVEGSDKRVYLNRALRRGDVYRAPNLVGLTLTTPDGGAVEIVLDGTSMGFAGRRGTTAEAVSLDPQAIVDRYGPARSG